MDIETLEGDAEPEYQSEDHTSEPISEGDSAPLPAMKTIYGVGCAACDDQVFGPNCGYYGPRVGGMSVWEYLRSEAEESGWFTVSVHGQQALVCSVRCAQKWLRGEPETSWGLDYRTPDMLTFSRTKADAIREAITSMGDAEFGVATILDLARDQRPRVSRGDCYQLLYRFVADGSLVKTGKGLKALYRAATPADKNTIPEQDQETPDE